MNSPMVITTLLVWRGLGFVKDSLIPQMLRSVFVTLELQYYFKQPLQGPALLLCASDLIF